MKTVGPPYSGKLNVRWDEKGMIGRSAMAPSHSFTLDFIVTAKSPDILKEKVTPIISSFLAQRGLSLSQDKTKIVHIEDGFDFLGFNIRKYKGKFLTKPSKSNIKAIKLKIKETVRKGYGWSGASLLSALNPIIKGWANHYRTAASKATFAAVDNYIYQKTFYWTMRKFSGHNRYQAMKRYFHRRSLSRNWIFSDIVRTKTGKEYICIHKMMDTKIRRHIKIRSNANPYLPEYTEYFVDRKKRMREGSITQWRRAQLVNVIDSDMLLGEQL